MRYFVYSKNLDVHGGAALVETLTTSTRAIPEVYGKENQFGVLPALPHLTEVELASKLDRSVFKTCHSST